MSEQIHMNETAVALRYNKDYPVIQANELVRSKQDELNLLEAKLVRLAITQVLKEDTDLKTYSCDVIDLAEFLGLSKQNVYRDVQSLTRTLMKKSIFIKDTSPNQTKGRENYRMFHWIDSVEYRDGTLTFKLSDSLKPYLIGLDHLFTTYGYDAILELPTNYSIRLYELIASYQNMAFREEYDNNNNFTDIETRKDEFIFTVEWLRDYFNCQDKYPNTGDFIRRVIDCSAAAIKARTNMNLTYRTVRNKRTITHVVFSINNSCVLYPDDPDYEEKKKFHDIAERISERVKNIYNSDTIDE